MVYVLDLLLVEYSVFIKCPSLNPLKIDGRARKHARVQNMAPHISCTNTHVILGLTCLYVTHMSVVCTYTLPICRSPSPGASNSHVFVQRRFYKLDYF